MRKNVRKTLVVIVAGVLVLVLVGVAVAAGIPGVQTSSSVRVSKRTGNAAIAAKVLNYSSPLVPVNQIVVKTRNLRFNMDRYPRSGWKPGRALPTDGSSIPSLQNKAKAIIGRGRFTGVLRSTTAAVPDIVIGGDVTIYNNGRGSVLAEIITTVPLPDVYLYKLATINRYTGTITVTVPVASDIPLNLYNIAFGSQDPATVQVILTSLGVRVGSTRTNFITVKNPRRKAKAIISTL